jgi:hypothetical protein
LEKTTGLGRKDIVLGLRFLQFLTVALAVTGFVWGSSDWLLATALVGVPMTPLSCLLMLYGGVGSAVIEGLIRVVQRKK